MNIKKIIACVITAVMPLCCITGCGGNEQGDETETSDMNTESVSASEEKEIPTAAVNSSYQNVSVDGSTVNMDEGTVFRGLGAVTGNNSSRLLMDYKTENPEAYWEIINLLFKPDYGAGLSHIKIEFGSDVNSSSGTEPSIMRSENEAADVTRGAGFMLAADALSVNPDITVDLLRWGEPKWVTDAFEESSEKGYEARYKWYKSALDSAYDTYGLKFTHLSADMNEAEFVDSDWIIYLADRLNNETDQRYDYSAIKIVASDELGSWNIADAMTDNEQLRNAVDILAEHYNTWSNDKVKTLNSEYGKEVWYTEGVASTNIAKLAVTSNGSGLNGTNGALDVCNRIINGYYNGRMTMYEYQPAVAAYYSGAKYFPKSLLNAQNPWSGYYEADCGIWTSAHFTHFIKNGWRYIDSACFGDGKEAHAISQTTNNYMAVTDPETGDYSIVICNDSDTQRNYTFTLENMDKANAPFTVWETRGPDEGQAYDANYFKNIGTYKPAETEGKFSYSIEVKPYSIVTVTTLNKTADVSVYNCSYEDIPLDINYSDDFEYSAEFLSARGNAPLYTADYGGAFEVAEVDGNKVLMQMINADNKPTDWRYRSTPKPTASLGDDRWSDCCAQIDFRLASSASDNYIALGVRYLTAELSTSTARNGYELEISPSGSWKLIKNTRTLEKGTVEGFDGTAWHTVKLTAVQNVVSAELDGEELIVYTDSEPYNNSGRISICSGLYNNLFDNLKVSAAGQNHTVTRVDDHDAAITYIGNWDRTVPDGYVHFNRTRSKGTAGTEETSFEASFNGSRISLVGETEAAKFDVYVDGVLLENAETSGAAARQCWYSADVSEGEHTLKVVVTEGTLSLDAIEY
ncbi:MAG: glycosyl hydrolase family 59 [Firmicutes bacterium]|nr:glycosyl hydrolase family 59 [[Eubacterium] siraeum]MCM1487078.1 glycosyl hydrolase family 59 [Bacillota bacterium]